MNSSVRSINLARPLLLVLAGSLVLALSGQLCIPFLPVPVTFETMAVLLLAICLGPQLACAASLVYLAEGLMGIPVFAGFRAGLPVLLGMTGGYLLSFPLAAYIAGRLAMQHKFFSLFCAGVASSFIVLSSGTLFLSHFIGLQSAFTFGFKPFILIEIIKIFAVVAGVLASKTRYRSN